MEWTPTENPNSTIVPGKMRSDRQELPEGFTKEDADKAEIAEAKLLAASRSRTARNAGATNALAAAAPTDCMIYFPAWQFSVCGEIRVKYDSLGGPNSFLLLPTSSNITNGDGVGQRVTFLNGPIYWHPNAGAHPVLNHFMMKWGEHGWEAGWLGYPTTDEIVLQNGRRQEFQSGAAIYWSPLSLGIVGGSVRAKYYALGAETGPLGYPSTDEIWATKYNGRYNNFLNGTITWSGQTGARVLYGAIRDKWSQLGREDGTLGYPLADEQVTPNGIAHFADFENGSSIWWTAITGAHEIPVNILAVWNGKGAGGGLLGYPLGGPVQPTSPALSAEGVSITLSQRYQGGVINMAGPDNAYVGMYDPTPDPFPEPESTSTSGMTPFAYPPDGTWPPSDIPASYDTSVEVGRAANQHFQDYNPMIIRQGYWSTVWDDGWGQDKAEHYHQLKYVDSIEFVLESQYHGPRSNPADFGKDFWAVATHDICEVGWNGRECEEIERRTVHAIYDHTQWATYKLAQGGNPIGLVTAYCGGGNTPLSGTSVCDSWVDMALMNPGN
ncbi:LGFP repeat-containing protein [Rhodococcus artemisiae]|uniref:LGFP repeat-containing protein n=1 Tax=Rhodococcus artemisiae TaxID=714159 RepID=A0ABU7LKW2_9NOCA|nr:hypothetical protein [Rhodococcus artemisiae]MEE2062206.1 hypothetical protein [Rhodococcus artemisiae]